MSDVKPIKPIPTDEEYEATRQTYYKTDPLQSPPVKNSRGNYCIEEVVHHGDYFHKRIIEVHELNERTVGAAVRSGPYVYHCADDSPQVARVLADLKLGRVNRSHGWSSYRVVHLQRLPQEFCYDDYRNED